MKTLALCLYALAFLVSFCLGGTDCLMYFFPWIALIITLFVGIAQLFLWLFAWLGTVKREVKNHVDHRKWIL